MRRFIDVEQSSAAWLRERAALITGSRIKDVLAYKKRAKAGEQPEETADRANYRMDVVAGRLTGLSPSKFVTYAMQWGIDHEAEARALYEISFECVVEPVGFALHPTMDFSGCSPDGLVGDGILEIKCPETTTHLRWLLDGVVPEDHRPQMTWEMVCCECTWGHFVSYDPRLPEELQMFVIKYQLDNELADTIIRQVIKFNGEIENTIAKLTEAAYVLRAT
jgi:hypothetical protein